MSSNKIEVRPPAASSAAVLRKRILVTTILAATVIGGAFAATNAGSGGGRTFAAPAIIFRSAQPTSPVPAPTTAPIAPATTASLSLGINVAGSSYFSTERTFANLAFATGAWRNPAAAWADVPKDKLTPGGTPLINAALILNVPQTVWAGKATPIKCTWTGSGTLHVDGDARLPAGNHSVTFTWPGRTGTALPTIILYVDSVNASDPLANLDCREPNLTTNGAFDQRIVDDLKPYSILRFLDWSTANANPASVTWATRSTPARLVQDGTDGFALEHMVDLANAAGADPWFTIPWNADETYVRMMAKLVHDRLAKGHRAYFELSNETWNYGFPVATQLLNEGIAEALSGDKYTNGPLRYAEKSIWFHKLLTSAFQDDPARLVRVLNMQNGNGWSIDQAMGFRDTPQWVDAIATAPYFGHDLLRTVDSGVTDLPTLFAALETMRVTAIDHAVADKASAAKWKKRYLAYEGGQHIVPLAANAAVGAQMERSPLMHDMYQRYLADWKTKIGDTLTLYSATGSISQYGSWGIREYAGQPLADSPKRRAVLEAATAK
ncbi:hypothetical protein [Sphingomonas sp. CARO-RG-8B-R24-01]|uniref:hypothetical protein n=1 Tax=Sphingomonas sp. CARO-RG-8B-R24-01 TaxID=2914831 RepID=UPI001F5755F1